MSGREGEFAVGRSRVSYSDEHPAGRWIDDIERGTIGGIDPATAEQDLGGNPSE